MPKATLFPLMVQYADRMQPDLVDHPSAIRCGVGFVVVETRVEDAMQD